jgi:hypothetical protein
MGSIRKVMSIYQRTMMVRMIMIQRTR